MEQDEMEVIPFCCKFISLYHVSCCSPAAAAAAADAATQDDDASCLMEYSNYKKPPSLVLLSSQFILVQLLLRKCPTAAWSSICLRSDSVKTCAVIEDQ